MAIKLTQADIDFILAQLNLPGNDPRNGPLGNIIDPTGIRDVQGIGNNVLNPTWGAADQPFLRLTTDTSPAFAQGTFTIGQQGPVFTNTPTSYDLRGVNLYDSSPRTISNLVANQDGGTFFQPNALSEDRVLDNPATTPGGRISPLTGNVNPLPYSSYMTIFGQFFDHGLDFVHKGADGIVMIPLLPGDPLYREGATNNFMIADRTNTIAVNVGVGTTDALRDALGITETRTFGPVQGSDLSAGLTSGGVLVLNNVMIDIPASIAEPASLADIVNTINASSQFTNVVASIGAGDRLVLTPRSTESINTTSPYIDLSQAYGSAPSHTVFLKEYELDVNNGNRPFTTGELVSEAGGSMPTWATIKANALKIGITLHDYNVTDVPLVRLNADGSTYFDPVTGLASVVAQNKTTGEVVFVQDTSMAALANANLVLVGIGHAFLDDMSHGVLPSNGLTAAGDVIDAAKASLLNAHIIAGDGRANENIALTSIHEVFHAEHNKVLADIKIMVNGGTDSHGVTHVARADAATWTNEMYFQAAKLVTEMEYQHLVFGEFARKFTPNINAFAAYDVTIDPAITAEFAHAVYRFGHSMLTETVGVQRFDANTGIAIANTVISNSGGSTIKLTTEQGKNTVMVDLGQPHDLIVGNHITIADVVGSVDGISAAYLNGHFKVLAVAGNSVKIAVGANASAGLANASISSSATVTLDHDLGLIEAFLNPTAYSYQAAGELAIGMSTQVGYAIDELMTGALRNNLVGLPLDLATLNIVRGRDSGIGSLNEVRTQLFNQTGLIDLKPYESWDEFGLHLLNIDSLKNFIAAYARDHILTTFGGNNSLSYWNGLQVSSPQAYATALLAAADAAMSSEAFMLGNQNLNDIDLWLGGLAEAKVPGGMLGSTFDFVFALQMIHLQNADRFYYLNRLAGTDLLAEIEGQLFSDVIMRNTGVKHLYSDIFSVADSYVEISSNPHNYGTLTNLRIVGEAGFVGNTFYGNPGDYFDARGFLNPNGTGNASEMLGGTDNAERINALGGNDTVWGDGGADTIEGGAGADFLHGGDGNDVITDVSGGDFIWGDAGNDNINAGGEIDNVFGGSGNDTIRGGLGGDIIDGGEGADIIYGDTGTITTRLFSGINVEVMDSTGDADIIAGGVGNDTIYGGGGTDALDGGEGDDILYGGLGVDSLVGFHGNDLFIQDASDLGFGELIDGGLGFDTVDYTLSLGNGFGVGSTKQGINVNLADPALVIPAAQVGVQLVPPAAPDTFTSVEKILGSAYNDTISGGTNLTLPNGVILDEFNIPVNFGTVLLPVFVPVNYQIDGGAGQDLIEGGYTFLNLTTAGLAAQVNGWIADGLYFGHTTVAGSDTLVGGLGNDTISYANAMSTFAGAIAGGTAVAGVTGVSVDLRSQGNAQNTINAGLDTLTGFENIIGSAFSDSLIGDANDNVIDGGAGNDVLNGGAGIDTISYVSSGSGLTGTTGITLTLNANGTAQTLVTGTSAGDDLISNFENIIGTNFNDTLTGNNLANMIEGGLGADILSGGGGGNDLQDTVSYRSAVAGVTVTLGNNGNGTGVTAATLTRVQETDQLTAFENIIGSSFNDRLTAGNGINTIEGGDGNDTINGGGGIDTLSFASATSAVTVNLGITRAQNTLGAGTDTISNMENILGSIYSDTLTGNTAVNILTGGLGNDTLSGGGGADSLIGGQGDDTYIINNAGVIVTELANQGTDTILTNLSTISLANFTNVENVTYTGTVNVSITGNAGNNILIAGRGNNDGLIAGGGIDILDGGAGTGDTATLLGASESYIWSRNLDGTLTGTSAANSSQVTLRNIENVLFTGSPGQFFTINDLGVDSTAPTAVLTSAFAAPSSSALGHGTESGTLYLVNTLVNVTNEASITGANPDLWNSVPGSLANTPTNIPLTGLLDGTYKLYAVDPSGNLSAASANTVTVDSVAPNASVVTTLINASGNASVQSTEVGTAYLVNTGITVNNLASITGAADNQWNQVAISAINTPTNLLATGLANGAYVVYTTDAAGNLSSVSGNTVTIDSTAPTAQVTAATISNAGNASVQSNETGTAYLVRNTVTVTNEASITGAADNVWNSVEISSANTATNLSAAGLADGTYRVYTRDAAGNLSAVAGSSVIIDSTAPTVNSVALTAATDNVGSFLNAGDKVRASVVFSENVTVNTTNGTPTLGLTIGATPVAANYLSGSGTNTLVFEYTILASQNDVNGIAIAANGITLNGGTILDGASNSAVLSHALVADNASYLVDTGAPTAIVTAATITPAANAVVQSSETGTAYLVNTGVTVNNLANITSAVDNQWNSVAIGAANSNTNLSATGLTDGTYRVYTVDAAGNLSTASSDLITIDTAPTVNSVALTAATDNVGSFLNAGDKVRASVVFSENVTVNTTNGTPTLGLTIGATPVAANYLSGSGTNTLVFEYTILASQNDVNGIAIAANGITLNGGTILDGASNIAVLSHALVADNASYLVDTGAPTATVTTATINSVANTVVQSSETGTAYLVNTNVTVVNAASITTANGDQWNEVAIGTANSNTNLSANGLADGTYRAYTIDAAGNLSAASANTVTVDSVAPNASVVTTLINASGNASVQSTEVGTAYLVNTGITVNNLASITGAADNQWNQVAISAINTPTNLLATGLANGAYVVYTTDAAGNLSSVSGNTVTIDSTAPTAQVTAATISNAGNASVQSNETGTAYLVRNTVTVTNEASITGAADNVWNSVEISSANTATNLSAAGLADGTYRVYTRDAAGNLSAVAGSSVIIDSTAPTASLTTTTTSAAGSATVQSSELGLAYLVNQSVTVNGVNSITTANDNLWNSTNITAINTATSLLTSGLIDGTYKLYTSDAAGNLSAVSTGTVTLDQNFDNVAPTATLLAATIVANATVPTVVGAISGNAVVQSSEAGTAYLVALGQNPLNVSNITTLADNLWNQVSVAANTPTYLSASGLGNGTYRLYTADAAGNLSQASTSNLIVDNTFAAAVTRSGSARADNIGEAVSAPDWINALAGADTINTATRNDIIQGGLGNDIINGGAGTDILWGQDGIDTFRFSNYLDSIAGSPDRIMDFAVNEIIDLAAVDANSLTVLDQAFSAPVSSAAFTGVAGQLIYSVVGSDTLVQADINGDSFADMQIQLVGYTGALTSANFVL